MRLSLIILAGVIQKKNVPWSTVTPKLLTVLLPYLPIPSSEPVIHAVPGLIIP